MAPVEDEESAWLGSEGVSLSVLPAVATTSRPRVALAANLVSIKLLLPSYTYTYVYFVYRKCVPFRKEKLAVTTNWSGILY